MESKELRRMALFLMVCFVGGMSVLHAHALFYNEVPNLTTAMAWSATVGTIVMVTLAIWETPREKPWLYVFIVALGIGYILFNLTPLAATVAGAGLLATVMLTILYIKMFFHDREPSTTH